MAITVIADYLNRTEYDRFVTALLAIEPDPFTDKIEADAVKLALGEHGDIWPIELRDPANDVGEFGEAGPTRRAISATVMVEI